MDFSKKRLRKSIENQSKNNSIAAKGALKLKTHPLPQPPLNLRAPSAPSSMSQRSPTSSLFQLDSSASSSSDPGASTAFKVTSKSWTMYGMSECPECNKSCKYDDARCSSIACTDCNLMYDLSRFPKLESDVFYVRGKCEIFVNVSS